MTLILAGDIGGTKTILRLVEELADKSRQFLHEARYPSRDFPDLVPIVQEFLSEAEKQLGKALHPEKACFAIAGPVVNDTSNLTNLSWVLDARRLEKELTISKITLINDFAAVGYGILGLKAKDLCTLQAATPQPDAPIAVIGAGTGLGQGFLIPQNGIYQVFGSEGGHADFAPRNELEFQLLQYLREKYDIQRISAERVVSGQGIVAIYQFLRDRQFAQESPEIEQVIRTWEQEMGRSEKSVDPAAAIAKAALAGSDRLSEQTLKMFVEAYGAEAGNLAIKLLPYGGLYIAGGIAAKILPLMQEGGFLREFGNKGRVSQLLENVPVHITLNPDVGLIGAAICAARL
ncbi:MULTISPECIES: glucokinase [unclassified Coleofasciculus]|uniref:glucokinase n=1 Tax=unclassified Coleofasciculus TaxID=2692782 RepID=UPI0018822D9E|nr:MULTISPECIES: glucokinase [unclassified Coleofasciculus]MBE9129551.1 glucokinase [Coleofasciculus sp. LEGE 07081]MBE9149023.1 glucokinase [Coleofasciculus sp. LEGE 07092]